MSGNPVRILIAEDDTTSRTMLAAVLKKDGYEVVEAGNGTKAWEVFQQPDPPCLAILDWMMPEMDGPEVVTRVRARGVEQQPYLILLTSRGERSDIITGLNAGADDYIAKPYDYRELSARVRAGIRIITLQEALGEREKFQGVMEMAGAVCHELNQPLQIVSGFSELLMMELDVGDAKFETVRHIQQEIDRVGELTRKLMQISSYKSGKIPGGKRAIADIAESSKPGV